MISSPSPTMCSRSMLKWPKTLSAQPYLSAIQASSLPAQALIRQNSAKSRPILWVLIPAALTLQKRLSGLTMTALNLMMISISLTPPNQARSQKPSMASPKLTIIIKISNLMAQSSGPISPQNMSHPTAS